MAKKQKKSKKVDKPVLPGAQPVAPMPEGMKMPELTEEQRKEIEKKIKEVKKKVEKFQKKAIEKFKNYILGISILPPEKKGQKDINILVLVDDSDSKRMTKQELKDKLSTILTEIGKSEHIVPKVILSTELWQSCYDGNYEFLQMIAISTPVFDTGVLDAVKISEIHKSMVLKKFDKYIVSYVATGRLFRGEGTEKSDIDVYIIVDDTDVKKMTRYELVERLRAIVYQMAFDAAALTGIKRQLHIQTYLLTDFWEILKDSASPVIFTFLRDGIPFFDRGIYMPWKHLLDMGRIKPSREAIRKFNESGNHFFEAAKVKLLRAGAEDLYYSILNPAQSALMMRGFNPPTHLETCKLVREVFVEKEKLLEPKYADILDKMVKIYKGWEYGDVKELSGTEVEKMQKECESFRKRIKKLFTQIEAESDKEAILTIYDQTSAAAREAIAYSGGKKDLKDTELLKEFKKVMIDAGKIPEAHYNQLERVIKAKKDFDSNKIKKSDIDLCHRESRVFIRAMIEFLQRAHMQAQEARTVRLKHKKGVAEVLLLENELFISHGDQVEKAAYKPDGKLGPVKESSKDELDKALKGSKKLVTLTSKTLDSLKEHLGEELELLL